MISRQILTKIYFVSFCKKSLFITVYSKIGRLAAKTAQNMLYVIEGKQHNGGENK